MDHPDEYDEIVSLLLDLGADRASIPAAVGDAVAMASDVVFASREVHTLGSLAAAAGRGADDVADNLAHLGIRVDDPDARRFTEDDVALARFLETAVESILTDDEGREVLHVVATALSSIAEAAVAGHVQGPERRTTSRLANARLNAEIAALGLELGRQLSTAFRHHLRQAAVSQRRTVSGTGRELVTLTVGFLDLVGFTGLSHALPTEEIIDLVKAFEAQAHELAHATDTRIVKLIGDEVMVVAEKPTAAAEFVTGMIRSLDARDVVPRGGLAHGDLINVHGDYFGPVVNLAARLVDSAVPGEVLVDEEVARQVTTEPAGRRMLKGFDAPVRVHSLLW